MQDLQCESAMHPPDGKVHMAEWILGFRRAARPCDSIRICPVRRLLARRQYARPDSDVQTRIIVTSLRNNLCQLKNDTDVPGSSMIAAPAAAMCSGSMG